MHFARRKILTALFVVHGCGTTPSPEPASGRAVLERGPADVTAHDATGAGKKPAPESLIPATHELVGPIESLSGNAALGPTEVARSPTRDTLVVFYQDTQHEPFRGVLWLLDGPTGHVHHMRAWDWTFTADGARVVVGEDVAIEGARPGELSATQRSEMVARIGVSVAEIDAAVFYDGFASSPHLVQPVVVELASGHVRKLPLVGGGTLVPHDARIVGLMRPLYWEMKSDGTLPGRLWLLELDKARWKPLAASDVATARSVLGHRYGVAPEWRDGESAAPGTVLITTRNGNVGLMRVSGNYNVQAFRRRP